MDPKFILPSGYKERAVTLVLSRDRGGWRFYGRDAQGYCVPALSPYTGKPLGDGVIYTSRDEAGRAARILGLPAYAVWNGRMMRYIGSGAVFVARARDAVA